MGGCAFTIEGSGADVIRVKAVVIKREKRHRQLLTQAFAAAEADAIQNSPGAEHAAEGTDQGEKGFRGEAHPVGAGLNRLVGQMADGSLNRFIDASLYVQVMAAKGDANGTGTAGFATDFLGPGVQIEA